MNHDNTPQQLAGASFAKALVDGECSNCDTPVNAGDTAIQALGLPGLYCVSCGTEALGIADDDGDSHSGGDIIKSLHEEYEIRTMLGWDTPPALLVIDPDSGPVWRVGTPHDPDETCVGRGELNGDRLEVTLFQPFPA